MEFPSSGVTPPQPCEPSGLEQRKLCASALKATSFLRHGLKIRALLINSEPWFYARDLGRLICQNIDERRVKKLDDDQYRTERITCSAGTWEVLILSESGVYALLLYHCSAESRGLRRWLTHDVIPTLDGMSKASDPEEPTLCMLEWPELSISMLNWRGDCWIRLRDMPVMLPTAAYRNQTNQISWVKRVTDFLRG